MLESKLFVLGLGSLFMIFFLLYTIIKVGFLPSVSKSYYDLNRPLLFAATLWIYSGTMVYGGGTILLFISAILISLVGIFKDYRDDFEGLFHSIFATGGIVAGMLSLIIDFGLWYVAVPYLIFAFIVERWWKFKNHTYWIEVIAIFIISISLYLKIR